MRDSREKQAQGNISHSLPGYRFHQCSTPQARQQLCNAIINNIQRLEEQYSRDATQTLKQKIDKLQLRLKLIGGCTEMSLLRLDHLQKIFKHYCTHIFKTGRHMTFDRLEYEKVHLTMDRFFLFLKDFELNQMRNDKKEEVIDKNNIIAVFKKVSSSSRELSFEEFIQCLERVAVIYYDEKEVFYVKKEREREQKERRKQDYQRKQKARSRRRQTDHKQSSNGETHSRQDPQQKHENSKQEQQEPKQQGENDNLINQMMKDDEFENPNQQLHQITNRYAFEEEGQEGRPAEDNPGEDNPAEDRSAEGRPTEGRPTEGRPTEGRPTQQPAQTGKYLLNDDMLDVLTEQEKIEFFYQVMINVDSVSDYRRKMTALDLPIFQKAGQKISSAKNNNDSEPKHKDQAVLDHAKFQELKKKMEEQKARQKASPIPKPADDGAWIKAEERQKKRRQAQKQREQLAKRKSKQQSDAYIQKKIDHQKSVKQKSSKQKEAKQKPNQHKFNENQVDWQMIRRTSIDQLKLKQFNPNKFFNKEEDDKIFLDEYEGGRPRAISGFEGKPRNSINVVQGIRKRVGQVENREKKQEKQLDYLSKNIGHHVPIKSRFS